MIIFICIYLLIGIGIQVVGQLLDDEVLATGFDVVDKVAYNEHPDHDENMQVVDECKSSKGWLLIHVLLWPINVLIGIWYMIKFILYFKTK